MIDIQPLIGSPNTVMIASVTTIVLMESVHQRSLYHLTRDAIANPNPSIIAIIRSVSNILTTQAQAISILSDKLISQSVYSHALSYMPVDGTTKKSIKSETT